MILSCLKKRNAMNEILNDTNIEYFDMYTSIRESDLINECKNVDYKK